MDSRIKNSGRKGIRRHSYEGVSGWFVRYRRDGVRFNKVFYDSKHGGEDGSYQAAVEFHKQLTSYFPPRTRVEHAEQRRKNSNEIIGVRRLINVVKNKEYAFWQASWTPAGGGPHRHKIFSVNKYGEEGAKKLAIETRQKHLAEYGESLALDYSDDLVWVVPSEQISIAANVDTDGESEGAIALKEHRTRERSRTLREAKIRAFLEEHGKIYCELCNFNFEEEYGSLGSGLIEVHHTKAISDYNADDITQITDLILVCSNCHYVIHRDEHYERNYRQLMQVIRIKKSLDNNVKERRSNKSVQATATRVQG